MSTLYQPRNIARALSDPNTAAELLHLVARKGSKSGKKGKAKIKGGTIAGIVIAIVVAIIVIVIILLILRRRKQKKLAAGQAVHPIG